MREEIEERFFSFRDLFAALFFFVFGLSIDVGALGRLGWLLALAVPLTILGKTAAGYVAGLVGGLSPRAELQCGDCADRARGVHDHPRAARGGQLAPESRGAAPTSRLSPGSTFSQRQRSE